MSPSSSSPASATSRRTDAAERVASGLTLCADFKPPEEHSEWFKVGSPPEAEGAEETGESERGIMAVQRFATKGPGGTPTDIYEFWWADLSRFPAALRSFLAAFVGLFLALPSIGRSALREDPCIVEGPQADPPGFFRHLDFRLLGFLAWIVAVPVVAISAVMLMVVGAITVATALPDAESVIGAFVLGLYGIAVPGAGLLLLHHYEKKSGRAPSLVLGALAVAAAAGIFGWRLAERGIHKQSIGLSFADTATVFVAYPIRIVWLGVLVVALTATAVLAVRLLRPGERRTRRRARTVSAVITLGVGPFGIALLMAIFSAAVGAAGKQFGTSTEWKAETGLPWCLARPDSWAPKKCEADMITVWNFGAGLLGDAIYSLIWATGVALAAGIAIGLVVLGKSLAVRSADKVNRKAVRLTRQLAVLDSPWTCAFLVLIAVPFAIYVAADAWLRFLPLIDPNQVGKSWSTPLAAIIGGAVSTLLIAVRIMGISPTTLAENGKAPALLRGILDKPYDIATFMREPGDSAFFGQKSKVPMPRKLMLDRYRALMDYIREEHDYTRIVFVAHSQGTILTTTLLAETPVDGEVSLMTFGCPLRQLYSKRFPSQYAWVKRLWDASRRNDFVKHVNREWVNVAAADDPIGRTVFVPPPKHWSVEAPPRRWTDGTPKLTELLLGTGGHGSYWTASKLYKELGRLIET